MIMREVSNKYWGAQSLLAYFKTAFERVEAELGEGPMMRPTNSAKRTNDRQVAAGSTSRSDHGPFLADGAYAYGSAQRDLEDPFNFDGSRTPGGGIFEFGDIFDYGDFVVDINA